MWQRAERSLFALWRSLVTQTHRVLEGTWKVLVHTILVQLETPSSLPDIYAAVADATPEATAKTHWQAKVRQTLYAYPEFKCAERGVWGLA